MSSTLSWPSKVVNGLITLDDSIEPSYLFIGAPSISKSYNLSPEAEIIFGKEGVNLKA
jgi:hypothetical protein